MKNMTWKGLGFCIARDRKEPGDYCNEKTVNKGAFCEHDTCMVHRCKEEASTWFPLMPGNIRFCSTHRKTHAKKYGVDV